MSAGRSLPFFIPVKTLRFPESGPALLLFGHLPLPCPACCRQLRRGRGGGRPVTERVLLSPALLSWWPRPRWL